MQSSHQSVESEKTGECPNCRKRIVSSWLICPGCGFDLSLLNSDSSTQKNIVKKVNNNITQTVVSETAGECPNCRKNIVPSWIICPGCGFDLSHSEFIPSAPKKLEKQVEVKIPQVQAYHPASSKSSFSLRSKFGVALTAIVLIVIAIVWINITADSRLYNQAVNYQNAGQFQNAILDFDELISRYPNSSFISNAKKNKISAYFSWAQALANNGDYEASIRELQNLNTLTSTAPDGQSLDQLLAQQYLEWGKSQTAAADFQEAINTFDQAIKNYPNSSLKKDIQNEAIQTYILWAHQYKDNSDLNGAISVYKIALSKYPVILPYGKTAKKELLDTYLTNANDQLTQAKSSSGDVSSYLKDALSWSKQATSLDPTSSDAKRLVQTLNRLYSVPVYTPQYNGLTITQPLSNPTIITGFLDKIAIVNRSIESIPKSNISLGEDIQYAYSYSLDNFTTQTIESIVYKVLVGNNTTSGFYPVTIRADVYKVNTLSTFGFNTFIESQEVKFVLWIP